MIPPLRWWATGLLVAAALTGALHAAAEPDPPLTFVFHHANELYRQERFDQAAARYREILQAGMENGPLYYNLGNALLKSGRISDALWAYLKARAFMPRDADLRANLEYVQSLLSPGRDASLTASLAVRWLTIDQQLATAELALGFGLLLWMSVIAWGLAAWIPLIRPAVRPAAWLTSVAAGAALLALVVQTGWIDAAPAAIIIEDDVEVRFAPQETATTHFRLPEGTVVHVLHGQFGWVQVRRADGRSGWVPDRGLLPL